MTSTPPVIFIIFNRTDTAKQTFEMIRAARPKQLLVVADGPRLDVPGEAAKCAATRAIIGGVDWDCDVQTNFSETNLGIRRCVSSGISWAFEFVDQAVVLEHDCVPSLSFFGYCASLLDRYENDERVMMISGQNHLFGHATTADSYYFSRYPHVMWGWATWKRAWAKYDVNMERWPEIRDRKLFDQFFPARRERYYWESIFQYAVYEGKVDTWDYQWFYSMWANSGLCVTPAINLVRNIGLDAEATHTNTKYDKIYRVLAADDLSLPLTHPKMVLASSDKDQLEAKLRFSYHTRGLLGTYFRYLALKVRVSRAVRQIRNRQRSSRNRRPRPDSKVAQTRASQ
ncbi:methyltransferase type 11 [Mycobacterium mantenii]|uniref:Methyltransferase type 11 n=1 Tax=Mycobacterium mantenii TaxID=560555 RepID=A0A1A2SV08_MYCNT|nr:methyltransferase type 11 [Mycobacterium mantenii]OBH39971.1 methyltransferase type 11 [Mycobacterium mantenii]OBH67955.1 methyltransferase type 11 [Mycobacterium mantenii]